MTTELSFHAVLAGLPVRDVGEAIGWYGVLLGRDPDLRPLPTVAEWRLNGGALLQLEELPETAGGGFVRLQVLDLDAARGLVEGRGMEVVDAGEFPGIVRYTELRDPSGNEVSLVQQLFE